MAAVILEDQSLRDGLQFEEKILTLPEKVSIFRLLAAAGIKRIQAGSFVHPAVVPQVADTDELIRTVRDETPGVLVTALVLNERGLERALKCGLSHLSMSSSASDSHSLRNVKRPAAEAFDSLLELIRRALGSGLRVRAGVQCTFGCVYEGAIAENRVIEMAGRLAETGAHEIDLADTTGMANPVQMRRLVSKVRAVLPSLPISIHLHDTRGLGLANLLAAYESGATIFDVSAGGLGGCPFVKGAAGNVAAEDAVNLFEQIGAATGIDLQALCEVVGRYEILLGRCLPGRMRRVIQSRDGAAALVGERRPVVEGAPNLRDLGGYEAADGRRVKWGLIFRSSNLGRLTDQGLAQIKRLGIRLVCDFRTEAEAAKLPNRFPDSAAVDYVRLPIQHGEYEPTAVFERIKKGDYGWISEDFMIRGYVDSVERYPEVWGRFFHLLAEPGHRPLLFHCTGGKDRTGAAAALVLLALGVPPETVIADYGLSDGYNSDVRRAIYEHLRPFDVDIARVEPYFTAPESRLRALLKHLDARFGSAVGYLVNRAGVSEETIARLKDDLLA
jgi:hydroxymethylglutaryl-CoA lyase